MLVQPVILSGGAGSRLWPLSREHFPKQLLALVDDQTLIQATVNRLRGLDASHANIKVQPPLVVCNDQHRFLVAEQLRAIGQPSLKIVLEPEGKNTAPALTLAALAVQQLHPGQDPVLLVMPADHVILNIQAFQGAVAEGARLAAQDEIVTFGIVPDAPVTGYGYIKRHQTHVQNSQAYRLDRFVEKPALEQAKAYLQSGDYYWNSGIFMLRAGLWLEQRPHF